MMKKYLNFYILFIILASKIIFIHAMDKGEYQGKKNFFQYYGSTLATGTTLSILALYVYKSETALSESYYWIVNTWRSTPRLIKIGLAGYAFCKTVHHLTKKDEEIIVQSRNENHPMYITQDQLDDCLNSEEFKLHIKKIVKAIDRTSFMTALISNPHDQSEPSSAASSTDPYAEEG